MNFNLELNKTKLIKRLLTKIKRLDQKVKIMEVCGTHTAAISQSGLRDLLPANLELIAGPGCPVCVTSTDYLDKAVKLARLEEVIIATFADLLRVPSSASSLQLERDRGADIQTVYSPLEAVKIAANNPQREVVFLAVGFETTAPTIALSVKQAANLELTNFSLLPAVKTMPPVMEELVVAEGIKLDGFLCPGHVSSIIGVQPYHFLAAEYNFPGVIAGFEAEDIMLAIYRLVEMIYNQKSKIKNCYPRAVDYKGNQEALEVIAEVFTAVDTSWRGLGTIADSGLKLKSKYQSFAAKNKFELNYESSVLESSCICGQILTGRQQPKDCELFGQGCTPLDPVGPCMVSREGACAAHYKYESR